MGRLWGYLGRYGRVTGEARRLLATTFMGSIPLGISGVIQPLYLRSLGYNPSSIGILLGVTSISGAAFTIPASVMADHLGRRRVLVVSIVAYVLYFVMFGVSGDFYLLTLASLLSGFSWGTYSAPFTALMAEEAGPDDGSYVFSLNSFLFNVSFIIGNLSLGLVDLFEGVFTMIPTAAYRALFMVGAILSSFSIIPPLQLTEARAPSGGGNQLLRLRSWGVVKRLSVVNLLLGFGAGLFIPFVPLYMSLRYSTSDALIGTALALSNSAIAIAFLASPVLVEKVGRVAAIVVTQGLSIIPLLMIPLTPEFSAFVLLYSLRAVLMNMASPIHTSFMMSIVKEGERASVSGITTTAWTGGNAISSIIAGHVMNLSLDLPVYLCGAFYSIATAAFYLFFAKAVEPKEEWIIALRPPKK